MGSLSIWHWLIVLAVVALVFGTKRLGSVGSDLGSAIRGFKKAVTAAETAEQPQQLKHDTADASFADVKNNVAAERDRTS